MMDDTYTVGSWGSIGQSCPIEFRVEGDAADLLFGGLSGYLNLTFDVGSLRKLVKLGSEALAQMDAELPEDCAPPT
ncbi:MAG: hypothetical protein ACRDQY_08155 [Pseudonocardiaceae bacterium]